MLAPVVEYAARRLADSDDLMPTSLAHAQYDLRLISQPTGDWREIQPEQLNLIASEHENCLAAMRFAERAGIVPIVLGFNISLLLFWRVRGLLGSGIGRTRGLIPADMCGPRPRHGTEPSGPHEATIEGR